MSNPIRTGSDHRKQAVSIRMNRTDLRHVKRLAERFGVRDSDVIRFAIKMMLAKLAPLQDPNARGRRLVPVFLEAGPEIMRHFELDAAQLSEILNDGVEEDRRVEPEDIQLIALSGIRRSYGSLNAADVRRIQGIRGPDGREPEANGSAHPTQLAPEIERETFDQSLRQYLYEKYLLAKPTAGAYSAEPGQ